MKHLEATEDQNPMRANNLKTNEMDEDQETWELYCREMSFDHLSILNQSE